MAYCAYFCLCSVCFILCWLRWLFLNANIFCRSAWDHSDASPRPALLAAAAARAESGTLFKNMNAKEAPLVPGQDIQQRTIILHFVFIVFIVFIFCLNLLQYSVVLS